MKSFLTIFNHPVPCKHKRTARRAMYQLTFLVFLVNGLTASAQRGRTPLQLADQYFAAGEYYTAAHLYGQVLNPPVKVKPVSDFPLNAKRKYQDHSRLSRTDIIYKQAESYRLANYWNEAATGYKECIEKESSKYPDALYWYAVCQRSLGNFAQAHENFERYINSASNATFINDAKKELETLHFIHEQQSRPDSVLYHVEKITAPNSKDIGFYAMTRAANGPFFITSTGTDSVQNAMENPHHSKLYEVRFNDGRLESMEEAGIALTDDMQHQGAASPSPDARTVYFTQWKKENGKIRSAIYHSSRQQDGSWSKPLLLHSIYAAGCNDKQPFCTSDGAYLYFASDRPDGVGGYDIWYAPIQGDGTTGEPVNAGTVINTAGDEQAPFFHQASSTLVFSSNGRPGMGGFDLFMSKGAASAWQAVENMGSPVNSPRDDIYYYAGQNSGLLENAVFSSDRGSGCCLESYTVTRDPKNKKMTGLVMDCRNHLPLADASVTITDPKGQRWQMTTGTDGKYTFDLVGGSHQDLQVSLHKEGYNDTLTSPGIRNTDESDWLTDVYINQDICMEKKLVIKVENVVTVYFDYDKSDLKPTGLARLDSIYQVLMDDPHATIQISGYTDGRGTEDYNKKLSDRRAKACADYLISKGIEEYRISFFSFGACCPVELELVNGRDNAEGRSKNRRALINITKD